MALHYNGLIGLAGTLAILLAVGIVIGIADRRHFRPSWLIVALVLVAVNDACLTGLYGLLPDLLGGEKNWQGKLLALAATLVIAAFPLFGWRRIGLTLHQAPGSLRAAAPVIALYAGFFLLLALAFGGEPASAEDIGFQLTLPGLEEEPFYRGLLLYTLGQALTGRLRLLGVDWSWGALLSCLAFGLAHGFGYGASGFQVEPLIVLLTGLPALLAVWLALRTQSLVLPILLHNFGNAISLIV